MAAVYTVKLVENIMTLYSPSLILHKLFPFHNSSFGMIAVKIAPQKIKFSRVRLGVRVLSFHNFGNLGGQLKTRYDDTFGKK